MGVRVDGCRPRCRTLFEVLLSFIIQVSVSPSESRNGDVHEVDISSQSSSHTFSGSMHIVPLHIVSLELQDLCFTEAIGMP